MPISELGSILAGQIKPPDGFIAAVRAVAGRDAADDISDLLGLEVVG